MPKDPSLCQLLKMMMPTLELSPQTLDMEALRVNPETGTDFPDS